MRPEKVRAALRELGVTQGELAKEWDCDPRTVRRWVATGCSRHIAMCFDAVLRLKRAGLPWRKNEVSIGISPEGRVIQLTDAEAVERHAALMRAGAIPPR